MGAIDSGNEAVPQCLQLAGGLSPLAPWAHFTLRSKVVERAIRLAMIVELAGRHYDRNRQEFPVRSWDVTLPVQELAEKLVEEALGSIAAMLARTMLPLPCISPLATTCLGLSWASPRPRCPCL